MKSAASLILALFLFVPADAAVSRAPAALRGVLLQSLPGLSSVDASAPSPVLLPAVATLVPAVPSPTPSVLDARKSAALLERLPAAPADPSAPSASASPLKVLESVNATLKDFTPARLRELSDGDVAALSRVILDGAQGRSLRADRAAARALAEEKWRMIAPLKGKAQETVLNPGHHESHASLVSVSGLPDSVQRVDRAEDLVFRHYSSAEGHAIIVKENSLLNGLLPYIRLEQGYAQKVYSDLTGIFLTRPGVSGDRIGVPAELFPRYVDIRVPRGLPVLEIEKGLIYLIPLPGRTWDWREQRYRDWAAGRAAADDETALAVERTGGLGPRAQVPVGIVKSGRAR